MRQIIKVEFEYNYRGGGSVIKVSVSLIECLHPFLWLRAHSKSWSVAEFLGAYPVSGCAVMCRAR